jgi:hypothetical protein
MTFRVSWYIEDRVACITYSGKINVDDIKTVNEQIKSDFLANRPSRSIYVLFDVRELEEIPYRLDELQRNSDAFLHAALAQIIFVSSGSDTTLRFFADMTVQPLGTKIHHVHTLEEANVLLKQFEPDLSQYFFADDEDEPGEC